MPFENLGTTILANSFWNSRKDRKLPCRDEDVILLKYWDLNAPVRMGGTREPDDGCRVLLQHVSSTHEMRCYSASVDTAVSVIESVEILNMQRRGHVQLGFARDSSYTCNNSRQAEKRTTFRFLEVKKNQYAPSLPHVVWYNLAGQTPLGQSPRQTLSEIETPPRTAQVSVSKSDLWDVDQVGDGPAIKPTLASSLLACNCVAKFSHRPATNQPSSWQHCCHPLTGSPELTCCVGRQERYVG